MRTEDNIWRDVFQLYEENMHSYNNAKNYTQEEWLEICKKNWEIRERQFVPPIDVRDE